MAIGDTVLVQLGDGITSPKVTIKITEDALGNFTFEVTQSGPIVGDLQGIFFDVGGTGTGGAANDALLASTANSTSISGLTATGAGPQLATLASTIQDGNDSVKDLGNGNNMNGALGFNDTGAEAKGYDVGIGFGTSGIGKDDVRSVSFTFNNTIGLTIDDFIGMDFGVRMTSVGTLGGARDGSVKLTSSSFKPVADPDESEEDCVLEHEEATGDYFYPQIEGAGGVTVIQTIKSFTLYDEDGAIVASGDADDLGTAIDLPNGVDATITFYADGTYKITGGGDTLNADDHLGFKLTYTLSQTYKDASGDTIGYLEDTSNLTFDICGENDPPVAVVDDAGCIVEGGSASGNVILGIITEGGEGQAGGADSDIDRGDVLTLTKVTYNTVDYELGDDGTVTIDLNGAEAGGATLTVNEDGSWSFATNGMYDDLVVGDDVDLTFNYTISDGNGGTASADLLLCVKGEGAPGGGGGPADLVTAVDDDPDCGVEGLVKVTGNVLDNDEDSIDGHDLDITHVNGVALSTLDASPDGDWYEFGITGGTLKINAETGAFEFTYSGPGLPVGGHWDGDFTYTITDGDVSNDSADSDHTATVDLCVSAAAGSQGFWTGGSNPVSEGFAAGVGTLTFDDFFHLDVSNNDALDVAGGRNWGDTPNGKPPNVYEVKAIDLTFLQALDFGQGNGVGDETTPVVTGNIGDLVREAATAVYNFYDTEGHDAFVSAYEAQFGAFADADNDAAVLADLRARVELAIETPDVTSPYIITELALQLHATHE